MTISLDPSTYILKIRKGTSGQIVLENLPVNFNGYTARLVVKKTDTASDINAPLNITTTVASNSCLFDITKSDTDSLSVDNDCDYSEYKWGILVEDGNDIAINIIPIDFADIPSCYVYPEI